MHCEERKNAQHGDHHVLRDYIYFSCEDMKELSSELKATPSELAVNSVSSFYSFLRKNDTLRIEKEVSVNPYFEVMFGGIWSHINVCIFYVSNCTEFMCTKMTCKEINQ